MSDFTYYIGVSETVLIQPVYSSSVSDCGLVARLYFASEGSTDWIECDADCRDGSESSDYPFVNAFADNSGALSILTSDIDSYDPDHSSATAYPAKISLTDNNSQSTIEYEFSLILKDKCSENELTYDNGLIEVEYIIDEGDSDNI